MRIDIDFSIFTSEPSAEGRISGEIEVKELPRVGEIVSFYTAPNALELPPESRFNLLPKVMNVIHSANSQKIMLELQDVVLPNKQSVAAAIAYLEQGFGLFFDPIDE